MIISSHFPLNFNSWFVLRSPEAYHKANMHPIERVLSLCGAGSSLQNKNRTTCTRVRCTNPFFLTSNLEDLGATVSLKSTSPALLVNPNRLPLFPPHQSLTFIMNDPLMCPNPAVTS